MGACIASEGVGIDMRRCNSGLFFLLSTCWVAVSTILVCATCGGGVSAPWTSWVQSGRKQQGVITFAIQLLIAEDVANTQLTCGQASYTRRTSLVVQYNEVKSSIPELLPANMIT